MPSCPQSKAVARRAAKDLGSRYQDLNLIVAHLGGGISVGVHSRGRVIDVNNALDGDGPFAPERSGGVHVGDLISLCFSGELTEKEIKRRVVGGGGLVGYLATNDAREVEKLIEAGNEKAQLYYEAMAPNCQGNRCWSHGFEGSIRCYCFNRGHCPFQNPHGLDT